MPDITHIHRLVREARRKSDLTQRELAERVGTSQAAIAGLERGDSNPTIDTLARCAAATGFALQVTLQPLSPTDPIVDLYKASVDRTLLRENLRRSVDDRLRTLSEWQQNARALQSATIRAKRARKQAAMRRDDTP